MEEHFKDPRIVLSHSLRQTGISEKESLVIALDAGSSQTIVDNEYLKSNFNFSREIKIKVLGVVAKFYVGDMIDD